MHVLHVTPYLAPAWAFGPVPQQVFALARAERAHGLTVTVLTTDAMAPHERLRPGETVEDDVRIVRVPSATGALRTWLNLSTPIGFRRHASRLIARDAPDVVHFHEIYTVENLRTAAVLPPGQCSVLSPHDSLRGATPSWVRGAWHRFGGDALLARTGAVISASNAADVEAAALYSGRGVELALRQRAVVRNGIDATDATRHATADDARARFGLGRGPVVLFAGRLSPGSGLPLLIDAWAAWHRAEPEAQLLIVGADHGGRDEARARIAAAGAEARVHLAGHLTGRDALLAFAAADLFAVPGGAGVATTALLDALASGLCLLGEEPSDVMQAAAGAGVGRLVTATVDHWTGALQQAWTARTGHPSLRDAARAVAAQFGWAATAAATISVYERALLRA